MTSRWMAMSSHSVAADSRIACMTPAGSCPSARTSSSGTCWRHHATTRCGQRARIAGAEERDDTVRIVALAAVERALAQAHDLAVATQARHRDLARIADDH